MNALPYISLLLVGAVLVTSQIAPKVSVQANVCELPMEPGPCKGYFPRYFFDDLTGTCQEFIYGGCQDNGNNFETEAACQIACSDVKRL
ncbi:hypothetical protein DPMN_097480 [Dreissena polymorpha]|uniref:BPTI/Kunitz inhibitor domain-containing protein n=2 Tax=Dreissena polymorpha TaxID=45954 RepID=A0A9D4LBT4_DREPO|nr:hypothetical protein DPMN_097480 [Dreissena polymorpha]